MPFEAGPYIQAACFCEMVLEDKEGVLSFIRLIDTVTHAQIGASPPQDMPPVPYEIKLVLMLKSGTAIGRYNLRVVPELPDGSTKDPVVLTVHLEGEERGQNLIIRLGLTLEMEVLYWFKVYFEDQKLTQIPLRVKYNRVVTGSGTLPPNMPH